jgi:hypothetical protein
MRALIHITFVVPLAVVALLAFLVVLAINAIQDRVAFGPVIGVAYPERARHRMTMPIGNSETPHSSRRYS